MGYADIIVMTLSTNINTSSTQSITINDGDSILLGGSFQTTGGQYTDTLLNQFGCDSIIVTALSIIPTSIDELSQKVKIYPNPAKNLIHINSEKAGELILFSVAGEVIIKKQISTVEVLDVSNLVKGIYFLQINNYKSKLIID